MGKVPPLALYRRPVMAGSPVFFLHIGSTSAAYPTHRNVDITPVITTRYSAPAAILPLFLNLVNILQEIRQALGKEFAAYFAMLGAIIGVCAVLRVPVSESRSAA